VSLSALGALFSAMFEPLEGAGAPRETADVSRTRERGLPAVGTQSRGGFPVHWLSEASSERFGRCAGPMALLVPSL